VLWQHQACTTAAQHAAAAAGVLRRWRAHLVLLLCLQHVRNAWRSVLQLQLLRRHTASPAPLLLLLLQQHETAAAGCCCRRAQGVSVPSRRTPAAVVAAAVGC
jgi:hypothetical protein